MVVFWFCCSHLELGAHWCTAKLSMVFVTHTQMRQCSSLGQKSRGGNTGNYVLCVQEQHPLWFDLGMCVDEQCAWWCCV